MLSLINLIYSTVLHPKTKELPFFHLPSLLTLSTLPSPTTSNPLWPPILSSFRHYNPWMDLFPQPSIPICLTGNTPRGFLLTKVMFTSPLTPLSNRPSSFIAMTMKLQATWASWKPVSWSPPNSGGLVWHLSCANTSKGVQFASRTSPTCIPPFPSLTPICSTSTCPFQQISYDLITDLPFSASFDLLLIMVDHGLTKGVILCPTKKIITAEGIANLFFHKVFLCFSLYNKIISDRGSQFASAFAKELGKLLNYDLSLSTTYHSQSDRETEWVNQEIETYLQIFCGDNPTSWTDSISYTEFTHNHHLHSVTSQSLFFLMMGYEPHALPSIIQNSAIPAVETRLKNLTAIWNEALAAHELARQVMAACTQWRFVPFKKGEKVWLEAWNLKHSVTNPKFAPKREGPFTITKVLSPITYQLCLPKTWKIHLVFHATLLSPYCKNDIHGPNFPAPPPDLIAGEEGYKIDQILHHRGFPSRWSFLIQWKGYLAKEDSWVPEWDLKNAKSALIDYKKWHSTIFSP